MFQLKVIIFIFNRQGIGTKYIIVQSNGDDGYGIETRNAQLNAIVILTFCISFNL